MLKDITTIKLEGANFESLTSFDFFNPHDGNKVKTIKGTLLYGRNGTGKSTIARAFRKLSGEDIPVITNAIFCDDADQPLTLTEEEKKHVFIFDEDYVDKKVKLQEDHLETILMLGEAADLTEQIKKAEAELEEAEIVYKEKEAVYNEYCDARNVKSPQYYKNRMREELRGDDNWAGRDRKINGYRQNTSVNENTYLKFVTLKPSKPRTELIVDYNEKLKGLENAKTGASTIDTTVPSIQNSYSMFDDENVQQLLAKKIEKPKLSEREKKLFELIQGEKVDELYQRLEVFKKKETVECPYCFQTVTPEHKESLVESIEKVLNKVVKDHQNELQYHIIDQIIINLEPYKKLEGYQTCVDLIDKINAAIQGNNEQLKKKINNPYEPIFTNATNVKMLVTQLIIALADLEKARVEYNEAATKTDPIIKELTKINNEIAYYDIKDSYEQFQKQQKEYNAVKESYDKLKVEYEEKKKAVDDLEAQRKNVRIAVDAINDCMKYIFFADNRLKIEYIDGVYKLMSNGKSVRPCDVSAGERDIIGLSYFFTNILEGKEEKDAYNEDYLIVIDDPVSSFDAENRIGILSFLKYKLNMFLEGNPNTKALVMTHDLMTYYDVHKIFEEIIDVCKKKGYPQAPKFNCFEIHDGGLKSFCYKARHEYTELVKITYAYACGQTNGYEIVIGNMMRQALEAFSTFVYRKSIEDISIDEQILDQLTNPKYISYYKNLMYRLVLHGGSHKEEQIKSMKDFQFFNLISEPEKRRTARDILCLIYLLNKRHLLEHLKECGKVETELENWCQDIKDRAV